MATNNEQQNIPSPSQSRVSSSSQSQSYELIPKDDAFFNPRRDLPSPKASFPFKKVQSSYQSFQINKYNNQPKREQNNINFGEEVIGSRSIQVFKETSDEKIIPIKNEINQIQQKINHQQQLVRIQEKQKIIIQLQAQIEEQRASNQLERRANQIYAQGFAKIRELVEDKIGEQLKGEGVQQLVQKLSDILDAKGSEFIIIQEQEEKIRQLRAQLLKSSQNNINAIFNTQITETHCLQLQIKKMNTEISTLKQSIVKVTSENQQYTNRMLIHKLKNSNQGKKIAKIYQHQKNMLESESDEEAQKQFYKNKKQSKSKPQKKQSRESSSSSGHKRSKRLVSTQSKIGELIEGYKLLRDQYKILETAIRQMSGSQTDFKELFSTLRKQITGSIQNQIKQVNQSLKRPSSNHEQLKIARDLESKLNHLVNTLNAPEKVNIQIPMDDDARNDWKNVESVRKIAQLQRHAAQIEKEVRNLQKQKLALEEAVINLTKIYEGQRKQHSKKPYFNQLSANQIKIKQNPQTQQFLTFSRSDQKEEQIEQNISSQQARHASNINKLHSSQSYHESSKRNQVDTLYQQLAKYEDIIRQKQHRINELQNAIIDHIESKTSPNSVPTQNDLKEKYELYINNLKMLLAEARRQNQFIKKQLFKASQMNLSRANNTLAERNSISISERTTKNVTAHDRQILKRAHKANNFESIKARIEIEDAFEKVFFVLLELAQKIMICQEVQRITLSGAVSNCLKEVILQSRQRRTILYEQTIQSQEISNRLMSIGLYWN